MAYRVLEGVILDSYLKENIKDLADSLSFDIVITSGSRTPQKQASAMQVKYNQAGGGAAGIAELVRTYRDDTFARKVGAAFQENNFQKAVDIIDQYFSEGKGSMHGQDLAFDIRTTGGSSGQLSESQITELAEMVAFFSWQGLREFTPPHFHVSLPKKKSTITAWVWLVPIGFALWILRK